MVTVIKEMTVFVVLSGQVPIVIKVHAYVDYIINSSSYNGFWYFKALLFKTEPPCTHF